MRRSTLLMAKAMATATATALMVAGSLTSAAASNERVPDPANGHQALGRQILPANDGWASAQGGTTGGAAATLGHVYTVTNRSQLVAALLEAGDAPKIVYVKGSINANVDDANQPLSCADYAAGTGYTLEKYMAAFDPTTWSWTADQASVEAARSAAEHSQEARVVLKVPSNTTIVGVGDDATILGGNLYINGVNNVIVRNLTLRNTYDCFPEWSPNDNNPPPTNPGNWNSQFDNISINHGATHVWIDHNTFTDDPYPDSREPTEFGRPFQVHDGATDVTNGSDLVTISWNLYKNHDKTLLHGGTNSPTYDVGKLNITTHHNEFNNILERAPRVRYGHEDVYDNYYVVPGDSGYQYSWGVGVESHIWAENNYLKLGKDVTAGQVIYNWGGAVIHTEGNLVNGKRVDLLAAFNATHDVKLGDDTSWRPDLRTHVDPAAAVPALVSHGAGAGRLNGS